jgi:hypothetical protein
MLKRILIAGGAVLALLIVILVMAGYWTTNESSVSQTVSMSVGHRTVTISGHYKDMTQESLSDGVKIAVDGHAIVVGADQLTIDGKTQVLEPDQDVEILVDASGGVSVKPVHADAGGSANAPQ